MSWKAAIGEVRNISREVFDQKMLGKEGRRAGLNAARTELFYKLAKGDFALHPSDQPDIDAFSVSVLYPDTYRKLPRVDSPYSMGFSHEYDPAKNGQNLLKHGLGFGEVINYSKHFGVRMVHFLDPSDGERIALYSDLDLRPKENKLALPLDTVKPLNAVMSIVHQRGGRFRFISSRLLSLTEEKCRADIEKIIRKSVSDVDERKRLVDRSFAYVQEWLVNPALIVNDRQR